MRFTGLALNGAFSIEIEKVEDERGFFARSWCAEEFSHHGLAREWAQCSISFNIRKGTLRGLHFQAAPHTEAKLVRCTAGRVFDAIVDIRQGSPTRGRWAGVELSAAGRNMLYVPEGFAHGFQTLEDNSEVFYQISRAFQPHGARGIRWNDPGIAIPWPLPVTVMSTRDQELPLLADT